MKYIMLLKIPNQYAHIFSILSQLSSKMLFGLWSNFDFVKIKTDLNFRIFLKIDKQLDQGQYLSSCDFWVWHFQKVFDYFGGAILELCLPLQVKCELKKY